MKLRENEEVLKVGKIHWTQFLLAGVWAFLLTISAIANTIAKAPASTVFIILLVGFLPLGVVMLKNFLREILITNQRVYIAEGIISKRVIDVPFHKINSIETKIGILDRMISCGTILIYTGHSKPYPVKRLIAPEDFTDTISKITQGGK